MSERGAETPPDIKKEQGKKLNWHLTELPSGAFSVGTTTDEAGYYPADEEKGTADAWVAPADFIEGYLKKHDAEGTDSDIRDAVEHWKRDEEIRWEVLATMGYTRQDFEALSDDKKEEVNEWLEGELLRKKAEDLLRDHEDNIVFIKRSSGTFSRLIKYHWVSADYDSDVKVYFSDPSGRMHKTVDIHELLEWQDEGRSWFKEKSQILDQRREKVYGEIKNDAPLVLKGLKEIGAEDVVQTEHEYEDRRYAVLGFGVESETRKSLVVEFSVGDERYSIAGTTKTYGHDHQTGVPDDGDNYYPSWSIFTLKLKPKKKDKDFEIGEFVGQSRTYRPLLEHLKRWVGGEKKRMDEGRAYED